MDLSLNGRNSEIINIEKSGVKLTLLLFDVVYAIFKQTTDQCYTFLKQIKFPRLQNLQLSTEKPGTRNSHHSYTLSCFFLPQLYCSLGHAPFLGYSEMKSDTSPLSKPLL
jgi:hypothetical protein